MKENKVRQHKLTDKNPVVSALLFGVIGFAIMQTLMVILNYIISAIVPGYPVATGPVGTIVSVCLVLFWFKLWFKPEYLGSIKGGEYSGVWIVVVAYIAYLAVSFIIDRLFSGTKFALPTLNNFFLAFVAGMTEEACFRGMMVPVLMRKPNKKSLMLPIFIPTIVFAIFHMSNITAGADPLSAVLQALNSVFVGAAFTVLFLISGNILIPIAIHFLHDVVAFAYEEADTVVTGGFKFDRIITMLVALAIFIFVIFFITRPMNTEKVYKIWEKKWQLSEGNGEE